MTENNRPEDQESSGYGEQESPGTEGQDTPEVRLPDPPGPEGSEPADSEEPDSSDVIEIVSLPDDEQDLRTLVVELDDDDRPSGEGTLVVDVGDESQLPPSERRVQLTTEDLGPDSPTPPSDRPLGTPTIQPPGDGGGAGPSGTDDDSGGRKPAMILIFSMALIVLVIAVIMLFVIGPCRPDSGTELTYSKIQQMDTDELEQVVKQMKLKEIDLDEYDLDDDDDIQKLMDDICEELELEERTYEDVQKMDFDELAELIKNEGLDLDLKDYDEDEEEDLDKLRNKVCKELLEEEKEEEAELPTWEDVQDMDFNDLEDLIDEMDIDLDADDYDEDEADEVQKLKDDICDELDLKEEEEEEIELPTWEEVQAMDFRDMEDLIDETDDLDLDAGDYDEGKDEDVQQLRDDICDELDLEEEGVDPGPIPDDTLMVDFVIVLDTTGSMEDEIRQINESADEIRDLFVESGFDYQVSLVTFGLHYVDEEQAEVEKPVPVEEVTDEEATEAAGDEDAGEPVPEDEAPINLITESMPESDETEDPKPSPDEPEPGDKPPPPAEEILPDTTIEQFISDIGPYTDIRGITDALERQEVSAEGFEDQPQAILYALKDDFKDTYRDEAVKILILITDEPLFGSENETGEYSKPGTPWNWEYAIDDLGLNGFTVYIIATSDEHAYRVHVRDIGGEFYDIEDSFEDNFRGIFEHIKNIPANP